MAQINLEELLADLPGDVLLSLAVYRAVSGALKGLPATGRKAVDWAKALGCAEGTPGYQLAVLIDTIETQLPKIVMTIPPPA